MCVKDIVSVLLPWSDLLIVHDDGIHEDVLFQRTLEHNKWTCPGVLLADREVQRIESRWNDTVLYV